MCAQHAAFVALINAHLRALRAQHAASLARGADASVLSAQRAALLLRRAVVLHRAVAQIVRLPRSARARASDAPRRRYLRGVLARLERAAAAPDWDALHALLGAVGGELDALLMSADGVFEEVGVEEDAERDLRALRSLRRGRRGGHANAGRDEETSFEDDDDDHVLPSDSAERAVFEQQPRVAYKPSLLGWSFDQSAASSSWSSSGKSRSVCGLSCADLSTRDRMILWLYLLMVVGALVAVCAVTAQFVQQAVSPGSFIRSTNGDELLSPVVTVCLSQRGVPFSRLQLFDFVDAEGRSFAGTLPERDFAEQRIEPFKRVVERFWDNPRGEDCDAKVGDYFPFPVRSLNEIASGRSSTRCRQCYRVGSKHSAVVRDTSFENSSVLHLFTDNYFLQCMKSAEGLDDDSLEFLHGVVQDKLAEMQQMDILSVANGANASQLSSDDIERITWRQMCNIFYFAYFPRTQNRSDDSVDIRYQYNGSHWNELGAGPYFQPKVEANFLPEESLQMFVSTNSTTRANTLGQQHDVILIGANTQTFATFRPIIVYGQDRYDISSSTSALRNQQVVARVGYWLRYKLFYNYNRFVVDEYYRESTYPVGQWIVDLTGYATLFTGASVFSLLLLPLLRAMRRREKQRLLRRRPEVYVWSRARLRYAEVGGGGEALAMAGAMGGAGADDAAFGTRGSSVLLPGFNV